MIVIDHPAMDIPQQEFFDNRSMEFITIPAKHVDAFHLQLEHSLLSIARWESKWHTSFVNKDPITGEELMDYIRCMTINPQKNPEVYEYLTQEDMYRIRDYMSDQMSAWKMREAKSKSKKKTVETAETFYFAMIELGIPFECEKWHFNRLLALIDYSASKNGNGGKSGKSRSQKEMMQYYHELNVANRKKYHSKG